VDQCPKEANTCVGPTMAGGARREQLVERFMLLYSSLVYIDREPYVLLEPKLVPIIVSLCGYLKLTTLNTNSKVTFLNPAGY